MPEAVARYRVHGESMLHAITDQPDNRRRLIACLHDRHAWLDIPLPGRPAAARPPRRPPLRDSAPVQTISLTGKDLP